MYLALAAVIVAAALFVIVLAAWAGMLDKPIYECWNDATWREIAEKEAQHERNE